MEQMHARVMREAFQPKVHYGYAADDGLNQLLGEPGPLPS